MVTVLAVLVTFLVGSIASNIFCPESNGDNEEYTADNDYGLNIYAQSSGSYDKDCYIRYSRIHSPTASSILNDFINPSSDILVVSHGWQGASPRNGNLHKTSDQWSVIVSSICVSNANSGGIEPCEPTDHDSFYWTENGYNVIFLDWRQFSAEADVVDAEYKLYNPVYEGKTIAELIFAKLLDLLDLVSWNGDEIRFAGHSLGSQMVMVLGAKWKSEADTGYANKLTRIALLDHFFSRGEKDYLKADPDCEDGRWPWQQCARLWTGEYARDVLLPIIRGGDNPAVIENYRTSLATNNPFVGDANDELNERTVFIELKPRYYGQSQIEQKHVVALPQYLHCMKFNGNLDNNAPNCRMSTEYLKSNYCPSDGISKCIKKFVQIVDDGAYTTWDSDDGFNVIDMDEKNSVSVSIPNGWMSLI